MSPGTPNLVGVRGDEKLTAGSTIQLLLNSCPENFFLKSSAAVVDNIKMELQEMGGGYGDWMELAQDRDRWRALVSTVMNLRVP